MINYWTRLISQNADNKIAYKMYHKLRTSTEINSKWIQKIKHIFEETGRLDIWLNEKVQVGKDQEKAQSEKDSHSKNRGGKKTN